MLQKGLNSVTSQTHMLTFDKTLYIQKIGFKIALICVTALLFISNIANASLDCCSNDASNITNVTECQLPNPFENNEALVASASESIKAVIQSAISEGISLDGLDVVSYQTGLPIALSRFEYVRKQNYSFIDKYPNDTVPIFGDGNWLDEISRESLQLIFDINSISEKELIQKISLGVLNNTSFYAFDGVRTTLMGFLHAKASWFSIASVEAVINAGYTPTLSDLAYFTSVNADLEMIKMLWRQADGDIASIHKYPPFYESLSSIALFHGNFEALKFWLANGSTINPDPLGASAMQKFLFAKKQALYTENEQSFIVNEIAKASLNRHDFLLITKLFNTNLSVDVRDNLHVYAMSGLGKKQDELVFQSVQKIAAIALSPLDSTPSSQSCVDEYVSRSVSYIFNALFSKQNKQTNAEATTASVPTQSSVLLAQLAQSKKDEEAEIRAKITAQANEIKSQHVSELSEETKVTLTEVFAAAKANDWVLALQLLESIDIVGEDALNTLLSYGLNTANDPKPLIELINRGGKLLPNAYVQIVFNNKIELVEALLPYGLNIDEPVIDGGDVVKDLVNFGTPEMLALFMKKGVYPDLLIEGMDALDIVLERFSLKGADAVFLQHLMSNAVSIEPSHIAFVYELSQTSPAEYEFILKRYPQLTAFVEQKGAP